MDLGKLQHPGWWGLVVPVGLALASTYTPGTVRGVLLILMIGAVAWTVHHTEFGARRWKVTGIAAGMCVVPAIILFFIGRGVDAHQKPKEQIARAIPVPGPSPLAIDKPVDPRNQTTWLPKTKLPKTETHTRLATPQPSVINSAPGGIANSGNIGTATVIHNGPAERHLSEPQRQALTAFALSLPRSIAEHLSVECASDQESQTYAFEIVKVLSDNHLKEYNDITIRLAENDPTIRGVYVIVASKDDENFKYAQALANALNSKDIPVSFVTAANLASGQFKAVVFRAPMPPAQEIAR